MVRMYVLAGCLVGCATASSGGDNNNPDSSTPIDSSNPPIDAREIDAPPMIDAAQMMTLQQTQNTNLAAVLSPVCINGLGETGDNAWYRAFALADHGITGRPFYVQSVTFAMAESTGSPSAQVKIGTYSGTLGGNTLTLAQIAPLNSTTIVIPPTTTGVSLTAPIAATIPAGGQLVAEVFVANLVNTGKSAQIASSSSPETRPGYTRSVACSNATPTNVAIVGPGYPNSHIIITVTGQY